MKASIHSVPELETVIESILKDLRNKTQANAITFYYYDEAHNRLILPVGVGLVGTGRFKSWLPSMDRVAGKIVRSGAPIVAEDAEHHSDMAGPFVYAEGVKSAAGFPLIATTGEKIGVLFVNYWLPHPFSQEEIATLEKSVIQIADTVRGWLIETPRLKAELSALAGRRREEAALQEITDAVRKVLGDVAVAIWVPEKHKGDLIIMAQSGLKEQVARDASLSLTQRSSIADALRTKKLVKGDALQGKPFPKEQARAMRLKTVWAFPILSQSRALGVLCVYPIGYDDLTPREETVVSAFVEQAAATVENQLRILTLTALHDAGTRLTFTLADPQQLMQEIVASAARVMGADSVAIHQYDPAKQEFYHFDKSVMYGDIKPFPKLGKPRKHGVSAYIVKHGIIPVPDVDEADPELVRTPDILETGVKAYFGIRLKADEDVVGVLFFNYNETREFLPDELTIARIFANYASIAIRNARMFEEIRARVRDLGVLNEIGRALTSGIRLEEQEILELIYNQASRLMDTDNMYIALYDEATDTVRFGLAFVDGRRIDVEKEEGWQPRKAGKGRTEEIVRTKKPIFTATKAEAEAWYTQPEHEEYVGTALASWLGVPMMAGEKVLGVIATYHPTRDYVYSEDDLTILQAMASQVAIALDNAHMFYDVNRRLEALVEFGREVTSGIRLREDEVLGLIYDQASKLMDTDNMYIALYDEAMDTVRFGLAFVDGRRIDAEKEEGWQPRRAGKGKTEEIIRTKKPIFHATKAEAEGWYAQPEYEEYVGAALPSWLGVPMMVGEKVSGVIATYHPTRDYVYSSDDLEILRAMASQAAIALDSATLYRKAEKRRSQLETVREITNAITTELEPQACMERILDETIKLLGAHYATIQLVDEAADELVIHAQRGVEGRILTPDLYRIKIGEGITGVAAQEKRTIKVGNVDDVECYLDYIEGTRSEMATPLIEHGKVIGVLNVEDPRENAFDQDDKDLFELLAEEVVIAVQKARKVGRRVEAAKFEYLGLLAGGVAHRVGSKGGLIRLHVNNLRKLVPPENDDVYAVLDKIERDNGYLIELSDELFKPADAAETPVGPVDVNQLLRQAIRRAAIPPDIDLSFHEEDVPRVVGNRWLVEVFVELITNALRAMSESEEKRLTIHSQLIDENSMAIVFEDTGCGIASEEMPKLFNLFYTRSRGEETPSRGGYGLWYSKSIVTGMDGDLQIESEAGKGTQCTVLLSTVHL